MTRLVAEIGCNHKGDMSIAEEMIEVAARFCGADVVKFQKRANRELLTPEQYRAPHPNAAHAYGPSYGEHREALEFTPDQHRRLMEVCRTHGVVYSTSVWDVTSARQMAALGPDLLKVPSACNLNLDLLAVLAGEYGGALHVSLGMTSLEEADRIVSFLEDRGRASDVVLYACTSGYPVAFEDACLHEITRLHGLFGYRVCEIGYSGHHLGIAADIAAMTLGASWIERHFTLDRTWKGTDHAASLEPDGLRRLARDLRNVGKALATKPDSMLEVERVQRAKLKWRPRPSLAQAG